MGYNVMPGTQGICPPGWHLPTVEDWSEMEQYLGIELAAKKLKSCTDDWTSPHLNSNETGFTALPGGGFFQSYFGDLGVSGRFWTSNIAEGYNRASFIAAMYSADSINFPQRTSMDYSFSVRCIKD
jgi:uncharacterized protein (TIGR02145 family)